MAYSSYYTYQKYITYTGQDPLPVIPLTYSIDGEGTMPLLLKQENDPNCGYTGETEPMYRWTDLDPATDWICDTCECQDGESYAVITYHVVGYICLNGDKYEMLRKTFTPYTCVNGEYVAGTPYDDDPSNDTYGRLLELDSPDCI